MAKICAVLVAYLLLNGFVFYPAEASNCQPPTTFGPETARLEKFVLQVGIDDYLHVPKLKGSVRDLAQIKEVLTRKFSVPSDHVMALTNRQATHEAIISAFRGYLIENAKRHPNALIIFQFSGHGSRVPDQNGDKADHMDSTLVPVNSRDIAGKNFDIVDDEIRELFNELSRYTSNVVFILDCCYSGNPTRGEQTRGIPMDTRRQLPEKPLSTAGAARRMRGHDLVGMLPRDQRYISIAASLPHERANEIWVGDHWEGGLTHFLVRHLKQSKTETTYRELIARVANDVTTQFGAQHPQVEGDLRRPVLAGSADREDPFIRISKIAENRVTIEAGAAQGLTEGTILSIYAPDAHRLTGTDKRLTTARLTSVGELASTAELLQPARITTEAKAVVLSRDFGSMRTRVLLDPDISAGDRTAADSKMISETAELLSNDKAVEVVYPGKKASENSPPADVVLMRGRFGEVFKDLANLAPGADGKVHPLADNEEVFYLTGPDRTTALFGFAVKAGEREGAQRIADAIEHRAHQRALRAVNNAASDLNNQMVLKVVKVYGERDEDGILKKIDRTEVLELDKMDQDYHFDQGEMFQFRIENHSPRDLYVILFDISTDGAIDILYPPPGSAGVRIRSGENKFEIPQVFATTGPPGYETFKIIATTVPKSNEDFAVLEQGAVRGTGAVPVSIRELAEWTTTQINFVISNKTNQR
jgi:hypothetical protein